MSERERAWTVCPPTRPTTLVAPETRTHMDTFIAAGHTRSRIDTAIRAEGGSAHTVSSPAVVTAPADLEDSVGGLDPDVASTMLAVMSIPRPTDQVQGPAMRRRPGLGEVERRIRAS